jgi:hypothetical protein
MTPDGLSCAEPFAGLTNCGFPIAVLAGRGNPTNALFQSIRRRFEFLDALGVVDFAGIDVAELVDRHGVNPVEFSGIAAAAPEAADDAPVLALDDADFVVLAIRVQEPGLLRKRRSNYAGARKSISLRVL